MPPLPIGGGLRRILTRLDSFFFFSFLEKFLLSEISPHLLRGKQIKRQATNQSRQKIVFLNRCEVQSEDYDGRNNRATVATAELSFYQPPSQRNTLISFLSGRIRGIQRESVFQIESKPVPVFQFLRRAAQMEGGTTEQTSGREKGNNTPAARAKSL